MVAIARKLKIEKDIDKTMDAMPTPASGAAVPSRPMKAVSIRLRTGSRAREPKAGTARAMSSLSMALTVQNSCAEGSALCESGADGDDEGTGDCGGSSLRAA
jgi:hypothetical protein